MTSSMRAERLFRIAIVLMAGLIVGAVSYWYGAQEQRSHANHGLASTQAMLAFGHYKAYERIESLLTRKCYDAALVEARELKAAQVVLLSNAIRATDSDPALIEYVRTRDAAVLQTITNGQVPELRSYTTIC